jgi:hypothetical protein
MLERHPDVAIPPESHFIPKLWADRDRYGSGGRLERPKDFLLDLASEARFRSWDLPIQAVRDELERVEAPTLAQGIGAAFAAFARANGKSAWGDKTPKYVDHIELISKLFPTARFVHLVRDGRDVALSVLDMERLHAHAATAAKVWARQVAGGRAAGRALGDARYLELRYEDLLEDGPGEIRRVCAFLGIPFRQVMLKHEGGALERIPERQRGMHRRLALPPTKGLRDWRSQMSSGELAEWESVAGPQLEAFGYRRAASAPGLFTRLKAKLRTVGFWARYARGRGAVTFRRRRRKREREREAREAVR